MKTFIEKTIFWLNNARIYSLPISLLNWLVIFSYSLKHEGNFFLGILCLIGIALVHLATNLCDDYFDYKILCKDDEFMNSAQNCKCKYLKDNLANTNDLRNVIIIFLSIAALIGITLVFTSGKYVLLFMFLGLLSAVFYQKLSLIGLGEIGVIFAFGPLLYEGVYYVMTGKFSTEVLFLSIACVFFTNTILYTHMLMDFDGDECSHKITLCRKFKTKEKALNFILFFYLVSFIFITLLAQNNHLLYLTFLTIPMIYDLYKSLEKYNCDKTNLPEIKFWHYPLDNWNNISKTKDAPFYFRFFYSRNIVTAFLLIACIAILIF